MTFRIRSYLPDLVSNLVPGLVLCLTLALAAPPTMAAAVEGYAELAAAIRAGDLAQVQALLAAGVAAGASDGKGAAPLLLAASRGRHDMARALLARGADANARYPAYYNATPLMLAVNNHDLPMAQLLLQAGAEVDLVDSHGDPALNWACFYGDLPAVELLLQQGAKGTLVGHGNALEVSMRRGHQALVERLVDHLGLRRALSAAERRLLVAVDGGGLAGAQAALADGVSARLLDGSGRPVLARAARAGRSEIVALLLAAGADANAADRIGFTALTEAARGGHVGAARVLLSAGADANRAALANGLSMTALHAAASVSPGQPQMLRLLVSAGARPDALDSEQATALMWAINADPAAARVLVELGADPDLAPLQGKSPRGLAAERQLDELLAAMQRAKPV